MPCVAGLTPVGTTVRALTTVSDWGVAHGSYGIVLRHRPHVNGITTCVRWENISLYMRESEIESL